MIRRALFLSALSLLLGCGATPDASATTEVPPPEKLRPFDNVEAAMGASCASLDCHGQIGRNLRLYDVRGLRLSPTTATGEGKTTTQEIEVDERTVLALEPDLTGRVVQERGASPERLTLVRKARGVEDHKGGALWPEGSHGDVCLTSWLASATIDEACAMAVADFSAPQ